MKQRTSKKEIGRIFLFAKGHLNGPGVVDNWLYTTDWICHAIDKVAARTKDIEAAKKVITSRLGGIGMTVNDYLEDTLGIDSDLLTWINVQTFRHRWLDSLIVEYSK